jgi:hypothetical protein
LPRYSIPQAVNHTCDERSAFADLHASHSVHFDATGRVQYFNTTPQFCHAHFAQSSQQLSHLIWLLKVICRSFEQHLAELEPMVR